MGDKVWVEVFFLLLFFSFYFLGERDSRIKAESFYYYYYYFFGE